MVTSYCYRCCDFSIESEIELPYASPSSEAPDVWIRFGHLAESHAPFGRLGFKTQSNANSYSFEVDGIAKYQIREGKEILIQPLPGGDPDSIRAFLLSTAFAALLFQRGFLVLHGALLTRDEQTFVLAGEAGIGKSTMASRFVLEGAQLLSDELCAIKADGEGRMCGWPTFPMLALWEDTLAKQRIEQDQLTAVRPGIRKYHIGFPAERPRAFVLTHLVELVKSAQDPTWEAVAGKEILPLLLRTTYLVRYLRGMSLLPSHFQTSLALSRQLRFLKVFRDKDKVHEEPLFSAIRESMRA